MIMMRKAAAGAAFAVWALLGLALLPAAAADDYPSGLKAPDGD